MNKVHACFRPSITDLTKTEVHSLSRCEPSNAIPITLAGHNSRLYHTVYRPVHEISHQIVQEINPCQRPIAKAFCFVIPESDIKVLTPSVVITATESRSLIAPAVCSTASLHETTRKHEKNKKYTFIKAFIECYSNFHFANHRSLNVSPILIRNVFSVI